MLHVYPGDDPKFADVEWIRVDPQKQTVKEPSENDRKIFRAREIWRNM